MHPSDFGVRCEPDTVTAVASSVVELTPASMTRPHVSQSNL
jgi:hypothetical protein